MIEIYYTMTRTQSPQYKETRLPRDAFYSAAGSMRMSKLEDIGAWLVEVVNLEGMVVNIVRIVEW